MKEDNVYKFETIYENESDAIFRFCLVRVSDREKALDITQETFLRLWKTISENKEVRNTRAFLFTVAHRLIIDWYRKKKSISLESLTRDEDGESYDLIDESTKDNLEFGAEGRYLLEKISELTPNYRQTIYLKFVEDLSAEEIGGILGISGNAAAVRINRGLAELRKKTGYNNGEKK